MRKYIELTEYGNNGRTVIFADSIQGLCRVWDGECNKEFTEVMVSGYTFIVNEPIDEILERMEKEQSSYNSIKNELNGDMISRQAVQDYIAKYLSQYLYDDVREAVEVIDEYIGELPPVNPQPKTGYWIAGKYKDTCSHCRCTYPKNIGFKNYCPKCGAKMESEDQG